MDKRRDELHSFTIDHIKELCGANYIKVYGKTKDVLIELLLGVEFPGEGKGTTADGEKLSTTHLMEVRLAVDYSTSDIYLKLQQHS